MSSVFLVPLAALLLLLYVEGSLGDRALVLRLGPLLAVQFLLSTELLFTLTLAIVVAVEVAAASIPSRRDRLRRLWRPLTGAYCAAGVLTSPLLVYALWHFQRGSLNEPGRFSADLLNIAVPTRLTALNGDWARRTASAFIGNDAENGAYLGLPLLAIVVWFAWQRRRSAGSRLLLAVLLLAIVAELGPYLRVRGATYAPLPWQPLVHLPLLNSVLPARFAMYMALAAAVIAALWAAGRAPASVRVVLAAAAVAATLPSLGHGYWHGRPHRPAFYAQGLYRDCLPAQAVVLALPYPSVDEAMLWQAEARFRFRLADAWLSPIVPDGVPGRPVLEALHDDEAPPGGGAALVRLARADRAAAIVLDAEHQDPWRKLSPAQACTRARSGASTSTTWAVTLGSCRSRSGRRGASSTSSRRTSVPAASSAIRTPSSCSRAATPRSSCSTATRTPPGT